MSLYVKYRGKVGENGEKQGEYLLFYKLKCNIFLYDGKPQRFILQEFVCGITLPQGIRTVGDMSFAAEAASCQALRGD